MKIALAQFSSSPSPAENLGSIRALTAEAAEAGARLVVFPEGAMAAFGTDLSEVAEPLDGPFSTELQRIAAEHSIALVAGMFAPDDEDTRKSQTPRSSNTLFAVDGAHPESDPVHYEKIHLYDAFGFAESETIAPGSQPVIFTVDGIRIGLALCYDVRFPHLFSAYARAGTHASIVAASWASGPAEGSVPSKAEQWQLLARARALDSTQWILACDQADPDAGLPEDQRPHTGKPLGVGRSAVVAPHGGVVAEAGEGPQLLFAEIDAETVEQVRRRLPVLANTVPLA